MKQLLGIVLLALSITAWSDNECKPHEKAPTPAIGTIAICGGDHPEYEYA